MKIAARQFSEFTGNPPARINAILLYGPDSGQARVLRERVIKSYLGENADPFSRIELSEEALKGDPARIIDEMAAFSLTGGRRIILLRDANDKYSAAIRDASAQAAPDTLLVAMAGELTPRSALRKLFEESAAMASLACYPDEGADLATVIRTRLQAHGQSVDAEGMQYLLSHLGEDRAVTLAEMDKVSLYAKTPGNIPYSTLEQVVGHNHATGLDDVCNALCEGDTRALDRWLAQLTRDGTQPIAILRSVQSYMQRLYQVQAAVQAGSPAEQAISALRPPLFFKQAPLFRKHLQRWPLPKLTRALKILEEAELACKRGIGSPDTLCHQALITLGSRT